MKLAIGSDHAGYELKEAIKSYLDEQGLAYEDLGTHNTDSCDYPDFGLAVSEAVARKDVSGGILVCGTGIGMSMVANKVPGGCELHSAGGTRFCSCKSRTQSCQHFGAWGG